MADGEYETLCRAECFPKSGGSMTKPSRPVKCNLDRLLRQPT
jgi:hypothetical protein